MTAEIIYNGDLRTTATHIRSGNSIYTDAPIDNQGKGEAFSPTDLVAAALGTCMLTIMGIKARDHQIDMVGARAEVTNIMTSNPRRIARLGVKIYMPDKDYSSKEKRILERAAHHCPVKESLKIDLEEVLEFVW